MFQNEFSYTSVKELIKHCLKQKHSVLLLGHPGVGKTTLAGELAEELALPLITIHLAHHLPEEIMGGLFPDREKGIVRHFMPYWVPTDKPAFIFLDEINAGVTKLHQSIAYMITLERRVGPYNFHPGTVVMAAGNLEEDDAIVSPLSCALLNRFDNFTLGVNAEVWLKWAKKNGISPDIMAFIAWRREQALYKLNGERAFPTPRSWHRASEVAHINGFEKFVTSSFRENLFSACIGTAMTKEFFAFVRVVYEKVRDENFIMKIVEKGDYSAVNFKNDSFVYGTIFGLTSYINMEPMKKIWAVNVLGFIEKLRREYQILLLSHIDEEALKKFAADATFRKKIDEFIKLLSNCEV